MKKYDIIKRINDSKVIAIIRTNSKETAVKAIEAVYAGGIDTIEVTTGTPKALEIISEFKDKYGDNILMGAGTVLDPETARMCIMAGAEYIVTPSLNVEAVRMCNRYGVPIVPGVATATEIVTALENGVDIVKLFPASGLNPSILQAFRGPIPNVSIVPTGGINIENAESWLAKGAFALGVGGSLTNKIVDGSFEPITEEAKKYVELVNKLKKGDL